MKRLEFGRGHVPYTITEAIKVAEIAQQNPKNNRSVLCWMAIERAGTLPKRTAESLRTFYKNNVAKGLEEYIKYALEQDLRFSHAYPRIPRVKN